MATVRSDATRSCEAGDDSKHGLGTRARIRLSLLAINKEVLLYTGDLLLLDMNLEVPRASVVAGVA